MAESRKKKLQEHITEAQRLLSELGYNPGAADGITGPKTTEAVKAFQRDHSLAEDGEVTEGLLEQLRRARQ
jgi:peptidoglycan hydrolase-like protein with peptidoglycan-binding domain